MINNDILQNAFSNIERDVDSYIEVNGVKYGSKDFLKDLKVNIKADKDGIWIGRAIPKMLNAEIINKGITINAGDEIKPYFGVKIGDVYQYINVGTFYAQNPEYTEDRKLIKIVAYDKLKAAQTLECGAITYPVTVTKVVDIIASKLGLTVDKTNLLFLDYNIEKEVYFGKDKTVIELINAISQMSMSFAYLGYDNVLKFKRPLKSNIVLNDNNVFQFRFKDYQKQYNALVISRQPQNDDVALKVSETQQENIEMKLSNNPILDLDREFFITDLLNTAKAIPEYNGLESLNMQSNPLLEIGDIVSYMNKDVVIFEHEITMTRSTLKSIISSKSETDYKKAKGLEDLAVNTELYVDKVKNEIVAKIGDEVGSKLTELKITEEGITQRVKSSTKEYFDLNAFLFKGEDGKDGIDGLNGVDLSMARMIHRDPTFKKGNNQINPYTRGVTPTLALVTDSTSPYIEKGARVYKVTSRSGTATSCGGIYQKTDSRPNAIFVHRLVAKVPEGFELKYYSNDTGVPSQVFWMTDNRGTGRYEEYMYMHKCGQTGSFSTLGYVYAKPLPATPPPTSTNPLVWYVAYATMFDLTADGMYQEFETYREQTDTQIKEVASATIYENVGGNDVPIKEKLAQTIQTADEIKLSVEEKGKYRNLIPNSDGFVSSSGYRFVLKEHPNGNTTDPQAGRITVRDSDNSLGMETNWGTGVYHYDVPIEVTKKIDNYTLWLGNFFKSDYVTDVTVALIDKNGYHYSRTSASVNANSVIKLLKDPSTQSTAELAYLRFKVTISQTPTSQGIRIYPEQIALVEGDVTNLNWNMTYLSSNNAMIDITTKEILQKVGDTYLSLNGNGQVTVGGKNITLAGSSIELNGDTTVTGGFKLASNNIADIAGWEISSKRLSKKTTSGSDMIVIDSDYSFPYTIGHFRKAANGSYSERIFTLDWNGNLYAKNVDLEGKITATSGAIGNWSLQDGRLLSTTGGYVQLSSNSSYAPIAIGTSSSDLNFIVTRTGTLTAKGADITGTINVTNGSIGGLSITSGGLAVSGTDYYAHVSGTSSYPFFAGTSSSSSRFRVSRDGDVLARSITLSGGKVGGTTINSSSLSGGSFSSGSFTSGSYSGSSYGYGSFTSGSMTGNIYSGVGTLGGVGYSSDNGVSFNGRVIGNSGSFGTVYFDLLSSTRRNSSGYTYSASLEDGSWKISNSDIRLKENISELTDEFNQAIYDMPLIKYTYIADEKHKPQAGVNANYLMKTLPKYMAESFLHQDEITGLYGANYELLVPYMIKTIQDLNNRLKELENGKNS